MWGREVLTKNKHFLFNGLQQPQKYPKTLPIEGEIFFFLFRDQKIPNILFYQSTLSLPKTNTLLMLLFLAWFAILY